MPEPANLKTYAAILLAYASVQWAHGFHSEKEGPQNQAAAHAPAAQPVRFATPGQPGQPIPAAPLPPAEPGPSELPLPQHVRFAVTGESAPASPPPPQQEAPPLPAPDGAQTVAAVSGAAVNAELDAAMPMTEEAAAADDAFGAQVILKEEVRATPFTGWAEVAGFYTGNVALTRKGTRDDTFLTATFGLAWRKALSPTVAFDATLRGSLYRYNRFNELDFQNLDPNLAITWTPASLQNVSIYGRYGFTQLTTASSGKEFFNSHSFTVGGQKAWALSRAHAFLAGTQAQFNHADPESAERYEYSVFAGYHAQVTRNIEADLFYRYALYDYSVGGRRDNNHALSLSFRYTPEDWLSLSASTFLGLNRSNFEAFDYDVWNIGGALNVSAKF